MLGMVYTLKRGKARLVCLFKMEREPARAPLVSVPIKSIRDLRGLPDFLTDKITEAIDRLPGSQLYYSDVRDGRGLKIAAAEIGLSVTDISDPMVRFDNLDVMVDRLVRAGDAVAGKQTS